ncbi:MAG: diiron oxygenase [Pseudomonadota bacterium]|uniref:Ferritin-like domain-containing protein n=1 Tax=marine metagenome TaxID=408172 RepID=A0A381Q676_9ZZZZ|nr:ferritin [Acidobacteriota bacterium]MEC8868426.1 diiron oxygenase [Pseudomonadota bacterium]HBP15412.1 ferritin [Gammaproteobacteria bacterium]HCP48886.1 ferritin [Gammaproteobacteria bacterium]|tara:strand:- start:3433 stop:4560 length:1128 start_codon:yes stop_codon:yes gene_type:complete
MGINYVADAPREVRQFGDEEGVWGGMSQADVQHVAEIFNTPLTGSYNWDYRVADNRIQRLYELGKTLNWNGSLDVHWDQTPDWHEQTPITPESVDEFLANADWTGYAPFDALSTERKLEFVKHDFAWSLSQFLHGEQGALLVASQLASCAPSFNAKMYAASQTFDEARHVEVFNRYLQTKVGLSYPVNQGLKSLLDKILTDERWDLKFIGMQIVLEGLALAAFHIAMNDTDDPVLKELLYLVIRDEARHVTFGVNYLEEFVATLSEQEKEDRAQFAYEACIVSRDRLIPTDVYRHFGWDVEEARQALVERGLNAEFLNMLYARIIPNLSRIGLLTDQIRPKFEEMGVLDFENLATDGDIDWRELEKPLTASVAAG